MKPTNSKLKFLHLRVVTLQGKTKPIDQCFYCGKLGMKEAGGPSKREVASLLRRVAGLEYDLEARGTVVQALKESEERFRVIFDNLRHGLFLADKETKKFIMGNSQSTGCWAACPPWMFLG